MEQEEELLLPTLKLIIETGPRAGETHEFKPESRIQPNIRIGRVIRGNTLPIKDPGISTHHVSIHFTTTKWVITDLNSSNGTVLNDDVILSPMVPTDLNDGDVISIGEITSFIVKVGEKERRNNRRGGGGGRKCNFGLIDENGELGLGFELGENKGGGRVLRNGVKKIEGEVLEEVDNVGPIDVEKRWGGQGRRTRGGLNNVVQDGSDNFEEIKNVGLIEEAKRWVGRGRKTRGVLKKVVEEGSDNLEEIDNVGPIEEVKRGGGRGRRTRGGFKKVVEEGSENLEEIENVGPIEEVKRGGGRGRRTRGFLKKMVEEGSGVGGGLGKVGVVEVKLEMGVVRTRRITRSSKKMEESLSLNLGSCRELRNLGLSEKKGGGKRGKKNLRDESTTVSVENNEVVLGEEVVEELNMGQKKDDNNEAENFVLNEPLSEGVRAEVLEDRENRGLNMQEEGCENDGNEPKQYLSNVGLEGVRVNGLEDKGVEGLNLGEEGCEILGTTSRVESSFGGGEVPDLEKMTLGEWFEYLEAYLPKQIHEETEELILGMKQRAEKFHKYILQQQNAREKGKSPMG